MCGWFISLVVALHSVQVNHCWKLLRCYFSTCGHSIDLYWHSWFFSCWGQEQLWWKQQHSTEKPEQANKILSSVTITLQRLTFLSGDACTRELWWFPLLSFFSGVHTPGSVWVERSDSAESSVLFFQTEVPLLCSVSLLWGKTNASSSEPDREHKISQFATFKVVLKAGFFRC